MGAWIEVRYCSQGAFGKSYGSGSTRMYQAELAQWLIERTQTNPILVTEVVVLKGDLAELTTAKVD